MLMVNSSNMFSISMNLEVVMILPFSVFSELRLNMESQTEYDEPLVCNFHYSFAMSTRIKCNKCPCYI